MAKEPVEVNDDEDDRGYDLDEDAADNLDYEDSDSYWDHDYPDYDYPDW